MKQNKAK